MKIEYSELDHKVGVGFEAIYNFKKVIRAGLIKKTESEQRLKGEELSIWLSGRKMPPMYILCADGNIT